MADARTVVKTIMRNDDPKKVAVVKYSDGTYLCKDVRASYLHAFKAYQGPPDKKTGKVPTAKFGVVGLIGKKTHKDGIVFLRAENKALLAEKKVATLKAELVYLRDGEPKDDDGDPQPVKPEYAGFYMISASETNRPKLRSNKKDPKTSKLRVLDPEKDQDVLYSGCWVNILIRPWWQDSVDYGKRINCGLSAVQFVRDDEPFGTGRIDDEDVDETFDEEDDGADAEDDDDDL